MAKLKAGHLSREVGDSCLQYWGEMGFTSDVLVSRFYRDTRLSIGGGADEVMLSIICKYTQGPSQEVMSQCQCLFPLCYTSIQNIRQIGLC
eukprot:XP_014043934.1 PREDICTED: probable acyl-CoA dehydrogenase 6 [Salmo salar]